MFKEKYQAREGHVEKALTPTTAWRPAPEVQNPPLIAEMALNVNSTIYNMYISPKELKTRGYVQW